jgi:Predicted amidophosphoribosyltransferases
MRLIGAYDIMVKYGNEPERSALQTEAGMNLMTDIIFPQRIYCICCGSVIDKTRTYGLCDKCIERMRWAVGRTCAKCGKILDDNWRHELCTDCRNVNHIFDRGFTCVQYGLYEKTVVTEYKYRLKSFIGREIAEIMFDRMEHEDLEYDIVTSVPVHSSRLKKRGFNQAALVAGLFAKKTGKPYAELLVREKHTEAMKMLGVYERMENVKDAFAAKPDAVSAAKGRDILLVDDIYTTGSTADSCAAALKKSGAKKVYVLTFAAGGNLIMPEET